MQAVIFDFDGTLADSAYVWERVDSSFFKKRGMAVPKDYLSKISTLNMYDGAVLTKGEYGISETVEEIMAEWQAMALMEYETNVTLKPGAEAYVRAVKARGARLALATAADPSFYTPVLKKSGIYGLFDVFADGSCGLKSKAHPEMFLHCAKNMGVEPEACLVFEDVLPAIKSAKRAGMQVTAVYEGKNRADWAEIQRLADKSIHSFTELL